jgi:tetratricopeptide (TPR) repeat protein
MRIDRIRKWATCLGCVAAALLFLRPALCQTSPDPLAQAHALLDAGKIQDAQSVLRAELAVNPSNADAHFLLGYALFREEKPRDSLAEFTAGAKFRRPRADELKVVAADYVMLGDYSDADKWFSQVVAETPNDFDAWYLLGRTKYNENEYAAAIADFEHALALHPRYIEAENNIGLAWKELNQRDKAQAAFQAAIDWQGTQPTDAQPFLNLGALLADQGDHAKAIPLLTQAVSLAPKNPSAHEELGKVYLAMYKLSEAQSELEQAVALAPDTSSLHYKLAQILRKEGQDKRAKEEFAICERLNGAHSSSKTPNPPPLDKPGPK